MYVLFYEYIIVMIKQKNVKRIPQSALGKMISGKVYIKLIMTILFKVPHWIGLLDKNIVFQIVMIYCIAHN